MKKNLFKWAKNPQLYIYTLNRYSGGYDEYRAFVIVASSEKTARRIACENAADEGNSAWVSAEIEKIGMYTGNKGQHLVLGDFIAG